MQTTHKKMIYAALFAALTFVATSIIRIPTPGTSGYVHPGDAFVILGGILLGPLWGALAGGIGSALSDLVGGYVIYIPITFLIKGLAGGLVGYAFHSFRGAFKKAPLRVIIGGVICTLIVALGYLFCESFLYGFAAALASFLPNLIQGITGIILSSVLYPILSKIPDLQAFHRHK
ncbi:ECF transporter S component [Ohessyouella blattaphilus]|uniref:ECF transporter S component n=1 Tax=Ohessyouella blattaphilus TaxID=2949333 RepID=A0ABT1EJH5_9FIRM|nr:ECF transporter S component [Ohessyouella blattaphilus]MCP1109846.1 ECF transporter S component [Ohessyouella blattaphilus]MCR8563240.1 ECF transporter S component [Ohessyouella blattaphilus]